MPDDDQNPFTQLKSVFTSSLGGIAAALAAVFALGWILRAFGIGPELTSAIGFGVMLGIIFGDPVAVWKGERSWRGFAFYFLAGIVLSIVIDLFTHAAISEQGEEDADVSLLLFLPLVLMAPIVFALPALKKALNVEKDAVAPSKEDLQISLQFPIFMTLTSFLHLAIPGALWVLGASPWVALVVMVLGIALVVHDVSGDSPEALARDMEDQWHDAPETAEESWANLRRGLGQSFASALFIGSVIYISLQISMPYMSEASLQDDDVFAFLTGFLMMAGVMLIASLSLFALGVVFASLFGYAAGRLTGRQDIVLLEFCGACVRRLFLGGMSWVRPDLEAD